MLAFPANFQRLGVRATRLIENDIYNISMSHKAGPPDFYGST